MKSLIKFQLLYLLIFILIGCAENKNKIIVFKTVPLLEKPKGKNTTYFVKQFETVIVKKIADQWLFVEYPKTRKKGWISSKTTSYFGSDWKSMKSGSLTIRFPSDNFEQLPGHGDYYKFGNSSYVVEVIKLQIPAKKHISDMEALEKSTENKGAFYQKISNDTQELFYYEGVDFLKGNRCYELVYSVSEKENYVIIVYLKDNRANEALARKILFSVVEEY